MILFHKNSIQSDVYSDYTILTNFQLVYVVIVRSFWVNPCRFLILCLYLNCLWRFNYHEGEGWDFINWFNPTPYLSLSQTHMSWIFFALNSLRCLFCFFCYCRNDWPCPFQLSFHNQYKRSNERDIYYSIQAFKWIRYMLYVLHMQIIQAFKWK
jgi:hypothetical protein